MQHDQSGHGSPETAAPEREQDAAPTTDQSPETLRAELEAARAEAQDNFAKFQRTLADFQNYKRRTEEERAQAARLANLTFVLNVLPIVDDLQRALDSLDVKLAGLQWVEGIRAIQRKFEGALEASGVTEIPTEGQQFDPNVHEAIGEDIGDEGKVVRVLQKGYRIGDRVIRPAMVMVGNGQ
jgi:molecular chaperone GrpE